jgi:hypothetical protein
MLSGDKVRRTIAPWQKVRACWRLGGGFVRLSRDLELTYKLEITRS